MSHVPSSGRLWRSQPCRHGARDPRSAGRSGRDRGWPATRQRARHGAARSTRRSRRSASPGRRRGSLARPRLGLGLDADAEALGSRSIANTNLLHLEVPLDVVVAAGPREGLLRVRAREAELLADDGVLAATTQRHPVRLGVEPGAGSPEHPMEHPASEIVLHASDDELVRGGPSERPAADRDPFGGEAHGDHDLG